jgi:hypothetical protein
MSCFVCLSTDNFIFDDDTLNTCNIAGFSQTDQKVDIVSYILLQIIFLFKNRFFDWEKSLGQEKGLAITSNKYGFTSDRVSETDELASMNASVHQGAMGLFAAGRDVMASTFVHSGWNSPQPSASSFGASGSVASSSGGREGHTSGDTSDRSPRETTERRTKYSTSHQHKVTKMNVLEMILPGKLASSFHSSQIPDDESSHHDMMDTSSKGLLGPSSSSSSCSCSRQGHSSAARSAYDSSLNFLSGFSFNFPSSSSYSPPPDDSSYATLDHSGAGSRGALIDDSETAAGGGGSASTLKGANKPSSSSSSSSPSSARSEASSNITSGDVKQKCTTSDDHCLSNESTHSVRSSTDV